jgi:hypothetical protein
MGDQLRNWQFEGKEFAYYVRQRNERANDYQDRY